MGWGGFLKGLGKFGASLIPGVGPMVSNAIDAIGSGAGAASQAAASNRGTKAQLMLDQNEALERQLMAREIDKRAAQQQAYRAAMSGSHAMSFKPSVRPAHISGSYEGLSPEAQAAGKTLYDQAMARMAAPDLNGPQGMPTYNNLGQSKDFQRTMKPGFWEKFGGIVSGAAPVASAVMGGRNQNKNPIMTEDPNYK